MGDKRGKAVLRHTPLTHREPQAHTGTRKVLAQFSRQAVLRLVYNTWFASTRVASVPPKHGIAVCLCQQIPETRDTAEHATRARRETQQLLYTRPEIIGYCMSSTCDHGGQVGRREPLYMHDRAHTRCWPAAKPCQRRLEDLTQSMPPVLCCQMSNVKRQTSAEAKNPKRKA